LPRPWTGFQIQSEYLRVSLERAGQLTQRYLEVSQAVVTTAASVARREAKKDGLT
jgi:hypothetical protein